MNPVTQTMAWLNQLAHNRLYAVAMEHHPSGLLVQSRWFTDRRLLDLYLRGQEMSGWHALYRLTARRKPQEPPTARQIEAFNLRCTGMTVADTSDVMGIAEDTVRILTRAAAHRFMAYPVDHPDRLRAEQYFKQHAERGRLP